MVTFGLPNAEGTIDCHFTNNKQQFGVLIKEVDGYYLFWANPSAFPHFEAESWLLRVLANKIDELNKPWDDEIKAYFEKQKDNTPLEAEEQPVRVNTRHCEVHGHTYGHLCENGDWWSPYA